MNDILPAILVKGEKAFRERLHVAEPLAPVLQIDVMDGHFVPNASWYDPTVIKTIQTPSAFELHLMVSDPTAYIGASQGILTIKRIVWHIEVAIGHDILINWCHKMNVEAGLAISPETPVGRLAPFAATVDEILVLGVKPGFSGQSLIPNTVEKAREIHERWPNIPLAFDGGVNEDTIPLLRTAGVTRFCAASAVFDAKDPRKAFVKLREA